MIDDCHKTAAWLSPVKSAKRRTKQPTGITRASGGPSIFRYSSIYESNVERIFDCDGGYSDTPLIPAFGVADPPAEAAFYWHHHRNARESLLTAVH
jgi:hypothetical protein